MEAKITVHDADGDPVTVETYERHIYIEGDFFSNPFEPDQARALASALNAAADAVEGRP